MHNYRRWHGRDRRGLELSAIRILLLSGIPAAASRAPKPWEPRRWSPPARPIGRWRGGGARFSWLSPLARADVLAYDKQAQITASPDDRSLIPAGIVRDGSLDDRAGDG